MTVRRALFDRAAHLRDEPGILEALRESGDVRVIVVRDGRVRIDDGRLVTVAADEVSEAQWALLGRHSDTGPLLLAAEVVSADSIDAAPAETWFGLRDAGGVLDPESTELLVESIALAGWLSDARFCARCGSESELRQGGWSRRCHTCQHDIFPRTDPAVIVAVESEDGEKLLLGANANWHGRMYSCFAGFVEAGESLELTVHREIEEEAGVRLDSVRYVGSQPWPYPRSLMVGFRATASDERRARPDGEEIIDVRWFTRDEIGSALRGDGPVGLPGPASIARALIQGWYEDRVPAALSESVVE
ncbi:NAD(+) diphosphatase [Microbacterium sp. AK031]|uniref:NAD(+) diphosphatase n=1 Tax=Microbacterium sp. AK031 TaxID=2723076 RepID=UPI002168CD0B|nr:NAD(+) diphosphatase [Microbacterium sp. AK031]MCS3842062.1 NAD+ diphosphatase [Microbacterium sp. AK031]